MLKEEQVIEVISHYCGNDASEIKKEDHLVDDLGFDSLDEIECAMELEEKLNITFSDPDLDKLKTVQAAIELVNERLQDA